MEIKSETFSKLLLQIEKVRRRKIADYSTNEDIEYIDTSNNLEKILVSNNHLIFGRRGCGKTTLILAALKKSPNSVVVPVDIQPIKTEETNDIILKILMDTLHKLHDGFIEKFSQKESLYKQQYKGLSGLVCYILKRREKKVYGDYAKGVEFENLLIKEINSLKKLKDVPEEVKYIISEECSSKNKETQKSTFKHDSNKKLNLDLCLKNKYKLFSGKVDTINSIMQTNSYVKSNELSNRHSTKSKTFYEKYCKKSDMLKTHKELIAFLFNQFKIMYNTNIVVYLDDFYQISIEKHPDIIQYFHDIYKYCYNSSFCFKLSALPNRLRTNKDGNVDMSYKDDFSPIKLDYNLSELNTTKEYLLSILSNLDSSLQITKTDITSLFNSDEVLLYSIIATGGIPRDFLLMFSNLIEVARTDNTNSIKKEHIYTVVKNLREDKDNNIEYDSDIPPTLIHEAVELLENDVVRNLNTNVILYPKALAERHEILLKNLVNLRYLHIIKDSTTSELKKKEEFVAYLIDMSFYAVNKRLKPGFDFRRFWEVDNASRQSQLRQSKIWSFPDKILEAYIFKTQERIN